MKYHDSNAVPGFEKVLRTCFVIEKTFKTSVYLQIRNFYITNIYNFPKLKKNLSQNDSHKLFKHHF